MLQAQGRGKRRQERDVSRHDGGGSGVARRRLVQGSIPQRGVLRSLGCLRGQRSGQDGVPRRDDRLQLVLQLFAEGRGQLRQDVHLQPTGQLNVHGGDHLVHVQVHDDGGDESLHTLLRLKKVRVQAHYEGAGSLQELQHLQRQHWDQGVGPDEGVQERRQRLAHTTQALHVGGVQQHALLLEQGSCDEQNVVRGQGLEQVTEAVRVHRWQCRRHRGSEEVNVVSTEVHVHPEARRWHASEHKEGSQHEFLHDTALAQRRRPGVSRHRPGAILQARQAICSQGWQPAPRQQFVHGVDAIPVPPQEQPVPEGGRRER